MYPLEQTDVNAYDFCEMFYYLCELNQKYLEETGSMTEIFALYMENGIQKKLHHVLDKIKTIDNTFSFNEEYINLWNYIVSNFHPDVKKVLVDNQFFCLDDACEAVHKMIAKIRVAEKRSTISSAKLEALFYEISEISEIYRRTVVDFELLRNLLVNKEERVKEYKAQKTTMTPTQFDNALKMQYDKVKKNLYRIREYHNEKLAEYNINFFAQSYKRQELIGKRCCSADRSNLTLNQVFR